MPTDDVHRALGLVDTRRHAIEGALSDVADRIDRLANALDIPPRDSIERIRNGAARRAYQTAGAIVRDGASPDPAEPCPYVPPGGGSCELDVRKHYHLSRPVPDPATVSVGERVQVVYYGSREDLEANGA